MSFLEMSINQRVNYLRTENLKLTLESFGDKIEMSKSAVARMEKGERVVSERTIKIICSEFNINEDWLRTGKGEIEVSTVDNIIKMLVNKYDLNELETAFISEYLKLNEEHKKAIHKYVKFLKFNEELSLTENHLSDDLIDEIENVRTSNAINKVE